MEQLRFPIGKFEYGKTYTRADFENSISRIEKLPALLRDVVSGLLPEDLKQVYREGGWNAYQLIHHIGDSHTNGYTRVRFATNEDSPVIKPYNEAEWVIGPDEAFDINGGLAYIAAVHRRFADALRRLKPEQLNNRYYHPEINRYVPIIESAAVYAHHGEHHLAHLKIIAQNVGVKV